jgi:hypothetical protein
MRVGEQDRIRAHIVGCAGSFGITSQKRIDKDRLVPVGNEKTGMAEEFDAGHDRVSWLTGDLLQPIDGGGMLMVRAVG